MSPFQHEIKSFPLFGWYPDSLKKSIMGWAVRNRPELVGRAESRDGRSGKDGRTPFPGADEGWRPQPVVSFL